MNRNRIYGMGAAVAASVVAGCGSFPAAGAPASCELYATPQEYEVFVEFIDQAYDDGMTYLDCILLVNDSCSFEHIDCRHCFESVCESRRP